MRAVVGEADLVVLIGARVAVEGEHADLRDRLRLAEIEGDDRRRPHREDGGRSLRRDEALKRVAEITSGSGLAGNQMLEEHMAFGHMLAREP